MVYIINYNWIWNLPKPYLLLPQPFKPKRTMNFNIHTQEQTITWMVMIRATTHHGFPLRWLVDSWWTWHALTSLTICGMSSKEQCKIKIWRLISKPIHSWILLLTADGLMVTMELNKVASKLHMIPRPTQGHALHTNILIRQTILNGTTILFIFSPRERTSQTMNSEESVESMPKLSLSLLD